MASHLHQGLGPYLISGIFMVLGISGQTPADVNRLRKDILANYNKHVRPVVNQSDAVDVSVDMYLMYIHGLDEKEQEFTFSAWIFMSWFDENLKWNSSDYNGVSTLLLPSTEIWRPDVAVSNSYTRMTEYSTGDYLVRVNSDGYVDWSPGDIFKTHCTVDITFYPFDVQTCRVILGTWMHDILEVNMMAVGNVSLSDYSPSGEWDVISTNSSRKTESFECCPGEETVTVTFNIAMARRKTFYILTVIIPVFLFSFLNVVDFVLPPESGEKMSLSVTVFLSFAFFMSILNESMPRTSLSFSILGIYMIIVMGMGTMSVTLSAVVIMLHHKARDKMIQGATRETHNQTLTVQKKQSDRPDFLPGLENFDTVNEKPENLFYDVHSPDSQSLEDSSQSHTESCRSAESVTTLGAVDMFVQARKFDRFFLWFSLALTITGATVVLSLLTYH